MLTTLYIVVSLLRYVFDDYPMHRLFREQPEYRRMNIGKGFLKWELVKAPVEESR